MDQVPGNAFSLAVLIGCQPNDGIWFFGDFFQLCDHFLFIRADFVAGLKIMLHINGERFFGEIPNMSHRGFDAVFGT